MAYKAPIVIDQGSDVQIEFNVIDIDGAAVDLTGYSAVSSMKKQYESVAQVDFEVEITEADGLITLSMDSNTTRDLEPGQWVYDIEVMSGSVVSRIAQGIVTVSAGVTLSVVEEE